MPPFYHLLAIIDFRTMCLIPTTPLKCDSLSDDPKVINPGIDHLTSAVEFNV